MHCVLADNYFVNKLYLCVNVKEINNIHDSEYSLFWYQNNVSTNENMYYVTIYVSCNKIMYQLTYHISRLTTTNL